jgi:hypothetical protein
MEQPIFYIDIDYKRRLWKGIAIYDAIEVNLHFKSLSFDEQKGFLWRLQRK